jgi:polar amino acid transport system permease protein
MQMMRYVVIPQAFRRMLPALGNNMIALLKDTSLVSAIGLAELAYAARTVAGAYGRYWEPYLAIAAAYWLMTFVLSIGLHRLEVHLARTDRV